MNNKYLFVYVFIANSLFAGIDPGTLDNFFGNQGLVVTDFSEVFSGSVSIITSLALQADRKIVAGGFFNRPMVGFFFPSNFALARYKTDGSLDDSFGNQGLVITDFEEIFPSGGGSRQEISSIVLQGDGKIIAGGRFLNRMGFPEVFALARYNTDGTRDYSFGNQGLVITDFDDIIPGGIAGINSLVLQVDGKIVAGGFFAIYDNIFALARYNTDGSRDYSFGNQGLVITDFSDLFPGGSGSINSLALQADGKILAGGFFRDVYYQRMFALARYNTDGTRDDSFGDQGLVTTDFNEVFSGGGSSSIISLVLQADGKIVASGNFNTSSSPVFALARYNTDGTRDDSFGNQGLVVTDFNEVFPNGGEDTQNRSLMLQVDGKIVAGGFFGSPSYDAFALARYNTDGTHDDSFGNQGLVITDFNEVFPNGGESEIFSLVLQADGEIVAGGFFDGSGSIPSVFALARYNTGVETSKVAQAAFGKYAKNIDRNKQLDL